MSASASALACSPRSCGCASTSVEDSAGLVVDESLGHPQTQLQLPQIRAALWGLRRYRRNLRTLIPRRSDLHGCNVIQTRATAVGIARLQCQPVCPVGDMAHRCGPCFAADSHLCPSLRRGRRPEPAFDRQVHTCCPSGSPCRAHGAPRACFRCDITAQTCSHCWQTYSIPADWELPEFAALCKYCLHEARRSRVLAAEFLPHSVGWLTIRLRDMAGQEWTGVASASFIQRAGMIPLMALAMAGVDAAARPTTTRPAEDGNLYTAEQFRAHFGEHWLQHWALAGLRLHCFHFTFPQAPGEMCLQSEEHRFYEVPPFLAPMLAPALDASCQSPRFEPRSTSSVDLADCSS